MNGAPSPRRDDAMAGSKVANIAAVFAGSRSSIVEQFVIEGQAARDAPFPETLTKGVFGEFVRRWHKSKKLYRHQRKALDLLASGANVVVATGTASGKSLIFQLPILRELIEGQGTAIVIYPLKALASDQWSRWVDALHCGDLSKDSIAEVNGDIPMAARAAALETSRVLLCTPDIVHSWLLRSVSTPSVRSFLAKLRYVVIDEAHCFDAAFGSNAAFMFRRLIAAHDRSRDGETAASALQWIAASATISEPADHLALLTGMTFAAVEQIDNGAPRCPVTILHIDGPARGSPAVEFAVGLIETAVSTVGGDACMAFIDSRQGAERVARCVGRTDVLPYRSGYERDDRNKIERALRRGSLRAVVATSALELGIDIPQFIAGFSVGVPPSRRALRQRIGRVGRSKPAVFALIAPANEFSQYGSTLREYLEAPVEKCVLYLENPIIQYQHALCLTIECGSEARHG